MLFDVTLGLKIHSKFVEVIKLSRGKSNSADSVVCLGKLHNHSEANEKWKDQISDFQRCNEHAELHGIDGEPIEFEWHIFPRFHVD